MLLFAFFAALQSHGSTLPELDPFAAFPSLPTSFEHVASIPDSCWLIGPVRAVSLGAWVVATNKGRPPGDEPISVIVLCHDHGVSVWALDNLGAKLLAQWTPEDESTTSKTTFDGIVIAKQPLHHRRIKRPEGQSSLSTQPLIANHLTVVVSSTHALRGPEMRVLQMTRAPGRSGVCVIEEVSLTRLESTPGADVTTFKIQTSKLCCPGTLDASGNQVVLWVTSGVAARVLLRHDWTGVNQLCVLPQHRPRCRGEHQVFLATWLLAKCILSCAY